MTARPTLSPTLIVANSTNFSHRKRRRTLKRCDTPSVVNFGMADILALDLPDGYDLDGALDLVRRGFRELAPGRSALMPALDFSRPY